MVDHCEAVKIAVLQRPTVKNIKEGFLSDITYHPNGNNIIVNETVFTFDHVVGPDVTQKEIFDSLIRPLLVKLKLGYNCTALAYGQTGTGKSYTMGLSSKNFEGDSIGVIPRCLKELLTIEENIENQLDSNKQLEILASFIEIYNEKVYDLFGENTNEPIFTKGQKYTGGTRKPLFNIDDCNALLMQGNKNRHVRPTKMNSQSSRSHAIFTIYVCSKVKKDNDDESVTMSCMNIVDLAGSEGVRRTGHQGMAMSEGVHINQGLLSIGKVLQAMTTGSKVIPYRDSVLSSVLQDSLNSNSYLTLLACISPHREDLSETLSTLRFAQNAKQLKNTPEINNIIADIKKNAKLKQTPYKVKPLQIKNAKTSSSKHTFTNAYGQVKTTIKSNTFCTPKKQRMELKKCNQTVITTNYERPKLSHIAMNLPQMAQLESTHNPEYLLNRSTDSNGSLLSLNMSTSTAFEGHFQKRNTNLSPIVRKCMVELKNDLEDNLTKLFQKNMHTLISQTPVAVQNNIGFTPIIRQELKNIMKEILSERKAMNKEEDSENDKNISTTTYETADARCQLFNSSNELFKIPEIPPAVNRPNTSSPIKNTNNSTIISNSFSQTFFADKIGLNKSIRRSVRISEKHQPDRSQLDDSISLSKGNLQLHRSARKSVLEMYQNRRRSIRLACNFESSAGEKSKKTSKNNIIHKTILNDNCNESKPTNAKKSLIKHRQGILDLLNKGSIKDLQFLPQIGQKTAYQIVTQRTLNGKFKSFDQIAKLPIWRGNAWERFAQANMLI